MFYSLYVVLSTSDPGSMQFKYIIVIDIIFKSNWSLNI
jgi:hypothetical protein